MPLNQINWAAIQPQVPDYSGIENFLPNFLEAREAPGRMANEREMMKQALMNAQLGNKIKGVEADFAKPLAEQNLQSKIMANALSKEFDIPLAKAELMLKQAQAKNYNRLATEGGAGKQYAPSSQAKLALDLNDIEDGYLPGSNRSVQLSPEDQERYRNLWKMGQQKAVTDTDTRKRVNFATNIDKTLASFNPEDLVRYSGISGELEKKIEQGKALTGKESENYRKYEEALTAVEILAGQVRQFYGESIQPEMRRHLEELANPSTWKSSPKLALRKFNQMKRILESETETFKHALKNVPGSENVHNENDIYSGISTEELKKIAGIE